MEKMTNKMALNYVLSNCEVPVMVREKLEKMLEQLDKRTSADRKPTKTQLENETYKELIMDVMSTEHRTVTDIMKLIPQFEDFSNQKVASLVKSLLNEGKIQKAVVKGRSYFFI